MEQKLGEGKKYDAGKRRWSLLDLEAIESVVDVLSFGAKKYGDNNWQNVANGKERYYDALMRHISKWKMGEKIDSETNLNHLSHAITNLMFLLYLERQEEPIKGRTPTVADIFSIEKSQSTEYLKPKYISEQDLLDTVKKLKAETQALKSEIMDYKKELNNE